VELDQTSINSALTGGYWSVRALEEIDSTQNALKNSSPKHGDVIVTNYQSAGRGRLDRRFEARPGTALLFFVYRTTSPSR
jgi:BirA family biotin operon repressor/biotin-[acetyl-CoA-carboxylase] ligase